MALRFVLSFDEPDYNDIVNVSVEQLFPDIEEEKPDDSFMPILKDAVEIIKDMPQEDKAKFSFYMLNSFLTSDRIHGVYRSIEKICKSTLDIQMTIDSIVPSREEKDGVIRISLDVSLSDIDYNAVLNKLYEIDAFEGEFWMEFFEEPLKLLSNISALVEAVLPLLQNKILSAVDDTIVNKAGINLKNMDYKII